MTHHAVTNTIDINAVEEGKGDVDAINRYTSSAATEYRDTLKATVGPSPYLSMSVCKAVRQHLPTTDHAVSIYMPNEDKVEKDELPKASLIHSFLDKTNIGLVKRAFLLVPSNP